MIDYQTAQNISMIDDHNAARAKAMEEINKHLDEAKRDLAYLDDKFISSQPDAT